MALRGIAVLCVAAGLAVAGCGSDSGSTDQAAAGAGTKGSCDGLKTSIAETSANLIYLPVLVAKQAGLDKKEGFTLEVKDITGSSNVIAAVTSGDADFAASSSTTPLFAAQGGAPLKLVAALETRLGLQMVVKDGLAQAHGLTEQSPLDAKIAALKGQKIGLADLGGGSDQFAHAVLRKGGLEAGTDAEIVALGEHSAEISGFVSNRASVLVSSPPSTFIAAKKGHGDLLIDPARNDIPGISKQLFSVVSASQRTLDEKPHAVACLKKVLDEALDMIHSDPGRIAEMSQDALAVQDLQLLRDIMKDQVPAYPRTVDIQRPDYENLVTYANGNSDQQINLGFDEAVAEQG